jgi:uroporphyrinogen decarboxylase
LTPKERAVAAFNLSQPDDIVPTFELQFQLSEELLGKSHISDKQLDEAPPNERDRLIKQNAELYLEEAETLDYSIIAVLFGPSRLEYMIPTLQRLKRLAGDNYLLGIAADGTMSIPNGSNMMQVVEDLSERPDEVHAKHAASIRHTLEYARALSEAGADTCLMCADYCFNVGPFLSPTMFREFVTPYLTQSVAGLRELGYYTVKHTDGNIMPILDQLVEAHPHALHSIDPQAGVDLAEVKKLVGDKVALCGNVHCGMLHNGTISQIVEDSKRALRDGMPGGGYFFCSSNTPFKGMPLENYLAMLDVRKQFGRYDKRSEF